MVTRTTNGGASIEEFDIEKFNAAYNAINEASKSIKEISLDMGVPVHCLVMGVNHKLEEELLRFGCPKDLCIEIAHGMASYWDSLES